jgi:hypothetical protein
MKMHMRCVAVASLLIGLTACGESAVPLEAQARAAPPDAASRPTVTGPLEGGARTGKPFHTTMVPLIDGYVEEEFLYSGTAKNHEDGSEAPYTTRIVVRRPTTPDQFNGTMVVDWNNVTLQFDIESLWSAAHDVLMGRGFIYVAVSAQKQGVDGSPLAIKFFDPVRYAAVSHPGDEYSFDMFTQAAIAALDEKVLPTPLRAKVKDIVGSGASQSGGRLTTYINEVQEQAGVFTGFLPQISGSVVSTRQDLVPILWINSQSEAASIAEPPAETGLLRYWEASGPPHTTNAGERYYSAVQVYGQTNGAINTFDPEISGQYGEMDPQGECVRSRYPTRYVWAAGLVALDGWLKNGRPPAPIPPLTRDEAGDLTFDEHGNTIGGFRLPVSDVPIATYYAGALPPPTTFTQCAPTAVAPLVGFSQVFHPVKMAELYPTHEAYLEKLEPSVAEAVAAGRLLAEHGEDLLRRARSADVTNPLPRVPPPLPAGGGPGV